MTNAIGRKFRVVSFDFNKNHFLDNTGNAISFEEAAQEKLKESLDLRQSSVSDREVYATRRQDDLAKYLRKIDALLEDEEGDYDEEFLMPSQFAVSKMKTLFTDLHKKFGNSLPVPKFVPNGKGGIEANWNNGNKYLQLIAPQEKDKAPYLFHKEGSDYNIEHFSSVNDLHRWVDWLLHA